MPYDEILTARIRAALANIPNLEEKKMFGGVGFMINGNMACGVHKSDLIVRVGLIDNQQALSRPFARSFDMTGRPMAGWVMVKPEGCKTENDLLEWVQWGIKFAASLAAKEK